MARGNRVVVSFTVSKEEAASLQEMARQHGFKSVHGVARAVFQKGFGATDLEMAFNRYVPLSKLMERNATRAVVRALGALTEEDLLRELDEPREDDF